MRIIRNQVLPSGSSCPCLAVTQCPRSVRPVFSQKVCPPTRPRPKLHSLDQGSRVAALPSPDSRLPLLASFVLEVTGTETPSDRRSWPLIPGLRNTSSVGYYNNSFPWNDISVGALTDFGRIVYILCASINGYWLPTQEVTLARADISSF